MPTRSHAFAIKKKSVTAAFLTIFLASAGASHAADQLSAEWRRWDSSARECIENVERVLKAAQFKDPYFTNTNAKDRSVSAVRGQYAATVQCVEEMKFVYFIVTGPNDKIAESYIQELVGRF